MIYGMPSNILDVLFISNGSKFPSRWVFSPFHRWGNWGPQKNWKTTYLLPNNDMFNVLHTFSIIIYSLWSGTQEGLVISQGHTVGKLVSLYSQNSSPWSLIPGGLVLLQAVLLSTLLLPQDLHLIQIYLAPKSKNYFFLFYVQISSYKIWESDPKNLKVLYLFKNTIITIPTWHESRWFSESKAHPLQILKTLFILPLQPSSVDY